jgi:hypothetical protein
MGGLNFITNNENITELYELSPVELQRWMMMSSG